MDKDIEKFIRLYKEENDAILVNATTRVSNSIVKLSPVAEGEFVADWDVEIGGWPSDGDPPPDPAKRRTRARLREIISEAKMGDAIFFENDDSAAIPLEFGYSKQAPQGVVRLTVRKWRSFVRGAAQAARNKVAKTLRNEE